MTLSLIMAACGGGTDDPEAPVAGDTSDPPAAETTVSVVLDNYSITADPASVSAGTVTFEAKMGSGTHALSVLRTDLPPDKLPTKDGGWVADVINEQIQVSAFHAFSDIDFSVEAELEPGAYVLICNVGGHYFKGMRTAFDVI